MKTTGKNPLKNPAVAFILIILVGIGTLFVLGKDGQTVDGAYTKYSNENFGFSFSYPSNWEKEVQESQSQNTLVVSVRDRNSGEGVKASVQVMVAPKLMITPSENYTLENLQNTIINSKEREGSKILSGAKDIEIDGQLGFKYSVEEMLTGGKTSLSIKTWKKEMIIEKDNFLYIVSGNTFQKFTENYKPKLDKSIDSFSFQS